MLALIRRLPALAWHAVVVEIAMYRNLLRWVFRRPAIPAGEQPIGYARSVTPIMALWIFASAAELPLVHILVPWDGVRIALLVVSVWGLVWMLGALAGLRVYPHLATETAFRVRNGALHEVSVPWTAITAVTTNDVVLPSTIWAVQTAENEQGTELCVAVSGRVNLQLRLAEPMPFRTRKGEIVATQVSCWVDEPREVAALVRSRIEARAGA